MLVIIRMFCILCGVCYIIPLKSLPFSCLHQACGECYLTTQHMTLISMTTACGKSAEVQGDGSYSFGVTQIVWLYELSHWGRVTHICVGKLSIIGSDNGMSPGRRQAIIWTNAGILLIGPLGTNFSEIWIGFETFSIKEMLLNMSSAKWRLLDLGLNELSDSYLLAHTVRQSIYIIKFKQSIILWQFWNSVLPLFEPMLTFFN